MPDSLFRFGVFTPYPEAEICRPSTESCYQLGRQTHRQTDGRIETERQIPSQRSFPRSHANNKRGQDGSQTNSAELVARARGRVNGRSIGGNPSEVKPG